MTNKILFAFVVIMLAACDVPGIIHIVNRSPGTAYYIYEKIADDDAIRSDTIAISNVAKRNETGIMFGFGHRWTDDTIEAYAAKVKKIEIISLTDTIQLSDKNEIIEFFKARRRGTFRNRIYIKVK